MEKDFIDLTPSELNTFLINETGISLIAFSSIAFEVVRWKKILPGKNPCLHPAIYKKSILKNNKWIEVIDREAQEREARKSTQDYCARVSIQKPHDRQILVGLRKKIENLENKIIETILETETLLHSEYRDKKEFKEDDKLRKKILWEYDLEDFFDVLFQDKSEIDDLLYYCKTGAPVNRRNLLCSMWAYYLLERHKKVNWKLIADLMDWYWTKLVPYEIYKDFRPSQEQTDPDYLKNQFIKHKKRWEMFFRSVRWRIWTGDIPGANFPGMIIVFGKKSDQIESGIFYYMELCIRGSAINHPGELWAQALAIYKSRAIFKRHMNLKDRSRFLINGKESMESMELAKRANLNWLVIFPDGSCVIDPE